jgi:hypothetical protein
MTSKNASFDVVNAVVVISASTPLPWPGNFFVAMRGMIIVWPFGVCAGPNSDFSLYFVHAFCTLNFTHFYCVLNHCGPIQSHLLPQEAEPRPALLCALRRQISREPGRKSLERTA